MIKNCMLKRAITMKRKELFLFMWENLSQKTRNFPILLYPCLEAWLGRFNGWSGGLNMDLEYKNFYLSSQSQYTFSADDEINNFYFSWSELGYQPLKWLYGGMALQETCFHKRTEYFTYPGFVVGFAYENGRFQSMGLRPGKIRKLLFAV